MTTLCSAYGSSPSSSLYFNEFMIGPMDEFYSYIAPDPDYLENCDLPSIHDDIMKIKTDNTFSCGSPNLDRLEFDIKPEIRNIDCMWSGTTQSLLGSSASSSFSDSVGQTTAVPLAAVTGNTQNIINNIKLEPQQPIVVVANNTKLMQQKRQQQQQQVYIKTEPSDDYEQQLQQHSIPNSRTSVTTTTTMTQNATTTNTDNNNSMQHIPPGTSLLRKSNAQQQHQQQQKRLKTSQSKLTAAIQIPKMYTSEFLRERDQLLTSTSSNTIIHNDALNDAAAYVRPDTPHSLDDDVACLSFSNSSNSPMNEFKHTVDLRACVIGSNNLSLRSADPTHFINHVSQQLQDTSKNKIDLRFVTPGCSLTEVLDVLANTATTHSTTTKNSSSCISSASSTILRGSEFDSDEESLAGSNSASSIIMDAADDLAYCDNQSPVLSQTSSTTMSTTSTSNNNTSSSNHHQRQHHHQQYQTYLHSDHSYTRGMDDPSIETPSDSDEEIDVVSIERKLPTNPSDKDRRALQTKVADKFSNARIVKNANGVRTIPPRRSTSYELPYTPASNSPVKSVASSRYPSPASTPYHNQYTTKYVQQQQQMMSSTLVTTQQSNAERARKRLLGAGVNSIEYCVIASSPTTTAGVSSKKSRGKKSKHLHYVDNLSLTTTTPTTTMTAGASAAANLSSSSSTSSSASSVSSTNGSVKRHYSLDETADTIEKRNLHNDMERQRRIGLKNLFEALKKQIPSIRDKERAPKVNILREAAKLCEALTSEDQQLTEQRALLKEQMRKNQEKLARLRAAAAAQRN